MPHAATTPVVIENRAQEIALFQENERLREEITVQQKVIDMLVRRAAVLEEEALRLSARLIDRRVNPRPFEPALPIEMVVDDADPDPDSCFAPDGPVQLLMDGRAD